VRVLYPSDVNNIETLQINEVTVVGEWPILFSHIICGLEYIARDTKFTVLLADNIGLQFFFSAVVA